MKATLKIESIEVSLEKVEAPLLRREMLLTFDSRIHSNPSEDWMQQKPYWQDLKLDYNDLNEHEQFCLLVYAVNIKRDRIPYRRAVCSHFAWSAYKVRKLFRALKEAGVMECSPTFNEENGMLSGRGYEFDYEYALKKTEI